MFNLNVILTCNTDIKKSNYPAKLNMWKKLFFFCIFCYWSKTEWISYCCSAKWQEGSRGGRHPCILQADALRSASIHTHDKSQACFKRRATAVLSWLMYLYFMNWVLHGGSTTFETKSSYCRVARLGFKRRATAVLKSNLIRAIEFGTAVARRLKRASLSVIFGLEKFAACVQNVMVYFVVVG